MRPSADRAFVRDAAFVRISRTRRWMLAGAAGLTAGLAALASAVLPGKSFRASHTASRATAARASVAPPLPTPANAAQLGLQSGSAPAPAPAAPQPQAPAPQAAAPAPAPAVVSGGS